MQTPRLDNYEQAEGWLLSMMDYERLLGSGTLRYNTRTFDLQHFRDQMRRIGDPHLGPPVIHVAGTKGKGSTCAFLETVLRECGFRTGLYTSPHLFKFTERIRVNGSEMPDEAFCRHVERLGHLMAEAHDGNADETPSSFRTVFEILTAAAFSYFKEQKVDICIVETGLGGRLDSTNLFDQPGQSPLIDIITAIGLDHTAILGSSLEAIAGEKAGIIRPHARTVLAPQASKENLVLVKEVAETRCRNVGAKAPRVVPEICSVVRKSDDSGCYTFTIGHDAGYQSPLANALSDGAVVCPSLMGVHQASNAATALVALLELEQGLMETGAKPRARGDWPVLEPGKVVKALENTTWPGRFQVMEKAVPVVVDGAHCAISAAALAAECRCRYGQRPAVIVTGFLRDKAATDLLGAVFHFLPVIGAVAVVPPTPRAVSAEHIEQALADYLEPSAMTCADSMAQGMDQALEKATECGGYVVIFGSLYLVGPALEALQSQD